MAKEKRKWSGEVTAHSDALDLEKDVFKLSDPKKIAASLETLGARQHAAQGRPFPLGDVDADLLHQPGGQESLRHPEEEARSREGRAALPVRSGRLTSFTAGNDMFRPQSSGRRLAAFRVEQDIEVDAAEDLRFRRDGATVQIQVLGIADIEGDGPRGEPGAIALLGEGVAGQGYSAAAANLPRAFRRPTPSTRRKFQQGSKVVPLARVPILRLPLPSSKLHRPTGSLSRDHKTGLPR